jgi:ABC-type dipeptide/oligopeptide/nickel transport system permease subunit
MTMISMMGAAAARATHVAAGHAAPLLVPMKVCPKAPPGAQKYADDVMGYVLWGVGIVFFLGLVIAIAALVAGRIVNMPHATKMGIVGIVMVIVAAIAYVVAPGIVDGILGNGCI